MGPALGGVLINAFGSGYAFLINTITYLPVIAALVLIDRRALTHAPVVPRSKHQLREGLRYVRSRPRLVWPIVLAGFVGAFGLNMPIVLSAFSKNIFHVGASGYGLLNAMVAIGSMGGALRSASQPVSRLRSIVGAAAAFGTIEALAALAPGLILFGVMLIAVGAASLTFLTAASATVHTTAEDAIRGRVMSLYLLVLLGGTPIGGPVIGYIAEHFGVRTAMLTCGVLPAAAAFVVAAVIGRSDFRPRARLQLIGTWATRLAR